MPSSWIAERVAWFLEGYDDSEGTEDSESGSEMTAPCGEVMCRLPPLKAKDIPVPEMTHRRLREVVDARGHLSAVWKDAEVARYQRDVATVVAKLVHLSGLHPDIKEICLYKAVRVGMGERRAGRAYAEALVGLAEILAARRGEAEGAVSLLVEGWKATQPLTAEAPRDLPRFQRIVTTLSKLCMAHRDFNTARRVLVVLLHWQRCARVPTGATESALQAIRLTHHSRTADAATNAEAPPPTACAMTNTEAPTAAAASCSTDHPAPLIASHAAIASPRRTQVKGAVAEALGARVEKAMAYKVFVRWAAYPAWRQIQRWKSRIAAVAADEQSAREWITGDEEARRCSMESQHSLQVAVAAVARHRLTPIAPPLNTSRIESQQQCDFSTLSEREAVERLLIMTGKDSKARTSKLESPRLDSSRLVAQLRQQYADLHQRRASP